VTAKLVQASYKDIEEAPDTSLNDFNPVELDEPQKPVAPAKKETAPPSVTVALDEGGDIAVPDFHGKTVREVTEACLRLGLDPVVIGSNLAQDQSPATGAKVRRGAKITVRFEAVTPKTNAAHALKQTANPKKTRN
jgi:hypothetical protein